MLRHLVIREFRAIRELELKVPMPTDGGQWLVVLGENGSGKSSLLRALTLALANPSTSTALVEQTSKLSPSVRRGAKLASVAVEAQEESYQVDIESTKDGREVLKAASHVRVPIYAYGSLRGSALGGAQREVRLDPYSSVATLFDPAASLVHADSWLLKMAYGGTVSPDGRALFDGIRSTLVGLLPGVEEIDVRRDRAWVRGPAVGDVPLASLSDGYLTTLGWTIDLIARHCDGPDLVLRSDRAFNEQMTGFVLIDELDLHLHPRWQTEVIARLRGAFPMMTFVVTTHNPLTLHGTRPGEVHVMKRTDDGRIEVVQRDLPLGISADQVLTGDWFGLTTTVDPDTKAKLHDHNRMLREGRPENDPERKALEAELRVRLGHYGETPIERMAQQVVAEVLDTGKPITDADRERVKAVMKVRLSKRGDPPPGGTSRAREPEPPARKKPRKATKKTKRRSS